MRVDLEEWEKHREYVRKINATPLNEIEWYLDGKKQDVSASVVKAYESTGMSNLYFPMHSQLVDKVQDAKTTLPRDTTAQADEPERGAGAEVV